MKNRPLRIIVKLIIAFILFNIFSAIGTVAMIEGERNTMPPIWLFLAFFMPYFLCFSKFANKKFWKKHLYSENSSTNYNSKSRSEDISSKIDDLKNRSKPFFKNMDNTLNEVIKVANEKTKPIINKVKNGVDELFFNSSKKSKDQAIEELKKLKELLELELISQEEFDNKSKDLKKIILGN